MFLFVPFSILIIKGLDYFYQKKLVFYSLAAAIVSIIIILSMTVYIQNNIMKDEISLWSDNIEKSPRLHHPRQCLAVALFLSGRLPEALRELQLALKSYESGLINKKSLTYGCIGEYYFITRNNKEALNYLLKSINFCPPYSYIPLSFDRIATILMEEGSLDKAEEMSQKALSLKPYDSQFRLTYCAILLKKKQPDAAIKEAQKVLRSNYNLLPAYNFIAEAYALKQNKTAENHFRAISKGANQGNK
jgi:tetratricopeptide (TPR) repeat protein